MHPLTPDLSQLTDVELEEAYTNLQRRFVQSTKIGPSGIIHQIAMLMEDYMWELNRRRQAQLEELMKNNKNFKDKIDIQ